MLIRAYGFQIGYHEIAIEVFDCSATPKLSFRERGKGHFTLDAWRLCVMYTNLSKRDDRVTKTIPQSDINE